MLQGIGVSPGRACAPVFCYDGGGTLDLDGDDGHGDVDARRAALRDALAACVDELDQLVSSTTARLGSDEAEIFTAHRLMVEDPEWRGAIERRLEDGQPLHVAVHEASEQMADMLRALPDAYLRERAADVMDVGRRILVHLGYARSGQLPAPGRDPVVLVAHDLTPSDTVCLQPQVVAGVVTEVGTRTSHAAILARQLGIPAIVAVDGVTTAVTEGQLLALDGMSGLCDPDPSPEKATEYAESDDEVPVQRGPARTRDGVVVAVKANTSGPEDVAAALAYGADGVGLYRTEFQYHGGVSPADEEAQAAAYIAAVRAAAGTSVTFRTMDVGGDKPLDAVPMGPENNPFLGIRGVRLSLRRPDLFVTQLRALARAAAEADGVRVMIPMVSGLDELRAVRGLLADVPGSERFLVGTMVETPSAAILIDEILDEVDFVSVGTNDLTQYILAADRTHHDLGDLYDELHPAVIRTIARIVDAGQRHDKPVGLCGELAGDLRVVPLLVGLGVASLSVAPPLVPRVKQVVEGLSAADTRALADEVLAARTVAEVRGLVQRFTTAQQEVVA